MDPLQIVFQRPLDPRDAVSPDMVDGASGILSRRGTNGNIEAALGNAIWSGSRPIRAFSADH